MSHVILVPAAVHGSLAPVLDPQGSGATRLNAVLPQSVTRDPMDDFYAWHCRFGLETARATCELSDADLRQRLWDRRQIETWVAEHCDHPVLAQHHPVTRTWRLVFTGGEDDLRAFRAWFYAQRRDHRFEVPDSARTEIEAWLDANLHGEVALHHDLDAETLAVTIRNPHEAALFKLRWIGG